METPLVFNTGSVLGRTFRVWGSNLLPFMVIAALVQSPLLIYTAYVGSLEEDAKSDQVGFSGATTDDNELVTDDGRPLFEERATSMMDFVRAVGIWSIVVTIGTVLLGFAVTGAVSYGVFQQLRGRPAGVSDCIRVGIRKLLPVLGVGLVAGIAALAPLIVGVVFEAPALILVAFIPAAVLFCMFWVAVPVAVVERKGVFASMRRSAALTKGSKLSIFGLLVLLGILGKVVDLGVEQVMKNSGSIAAVLWVTVAVSIAVSLIGSVAAAVAYHDLRVVNEGVEVEELVAVFD